MAHILRNLSEFLYHFQKYQSIKTTNIKYATCTRNWYVCNVLLNNNESMNKFYGDYMVKNGTCKEKC